MCNSNNEISGHYPKSSQITQNTLKTARTIWKTNSSTTRLYYKQLNWQENHNRQSNNQFQPTHNMIQYGFFQRRNLEWWEIRKKLRKHTYKTTVEMSCSVKEIWTFPPAISLLPRKSQWTIFGKHSKKKNQEYGLWWYFCMTTTKLMDNYGKKNSVTSEENTNSRSQSFSLVNVHFSPKPGKSHHRDTIWIWTTASVFPLYLLATNSSKHLVNRYVNPSHR